MPLSLDAKPPKYGPITKRQHNVNRVLNHGEKGLAVAGAVGTYKQSRQGGRVSRKRAAIASGVGASVSYATDKKVTKALSGKHDTVGLAGSVVAGYAVNKLITNPIQNRVTKTPRHAGTKAPGKPVKPGHQSRSGARPKQLGR